MTGAVHAESAVPPVSSLRVWAALGVVYVVWGSTYLAIRVMVETIPALLGAGVRFVLAGVLLLAVLAIRGGVRRIRVSRAELARVAVVGTLLAAGGNGLVTVGEKHVPSALAALLVASTPLWIVVFRRILGDRPVRSTLIGVGVGFAGVALLMLPGNRPDGVELIPVLVIVLAAISWGFGSLVSQRVRMPAEALVSTGWQMLIGGLVLVVAAAAAGEIGDVNVGAFSTDSVLALAYLILVGAVLAYSAYTWLLQNAPITQVSTYAYVNPVVAVILGAAILGEATPPLMLAASALIVTAVALIVRTEARQRRAT